MTGRHRSRRRWCLLFLVALVVAASCGGDDDDGDDATGSGEVGATPATANDLESGSWQLTSYAISGADDMTAASRTAPATASFDAGTVTGSTGCNNYNTTYELGAGGAITFSPVASTMAACSDVAAQEQALLKGYQDARKAVIEDDALQFLDAAGNPLLFFDPSSG